MSKRNGWKWGGMALLFIFILSGCGADLSMETTIHQDGSGTRTIVIEVPNDQMEEISGGEQALTQVLTDHKPSEWTLAKSAEEGKTRYTFSFPFSSIEDLNASIQQWTGSDTAARYEQSGTPFSRSYVFHDETDVESMLGWAKEAILSAELVEVDDQSNLINSKRASVILPSDPEAIDLSSLFSDHEASSRHQYPVEQVLLDTDLRANPMSRTLSILLTSSVDQEINRNNPDAIMDYLTKLSPLAQVAKSSNEGQVTYSIHAQGNTYEELTNSFADFFQNEQTSYSQLEGNRLFPRHQFRDRITLADFLGEDVQVNGGFTYTLHYKGKQVAADGSEISNNQGETVRDQLVLQQDVPQFQVDLTLQETSKLYYVWLSIGLTVGAVAVISLAWLFFKFRKRLFEAIARRYSNKDRQPLRSENAVVVKYCYDCGNLLEPTDRHCGRCGAQIHSKGKGA